MTNNTIIWMFLSKNDQFSCPINQKPHTLSGANSQCLQVCLKAVLFSACSILFGMVCQSVNLWAAAMIGMDLSTWILEWLYISVMWFRPLLSHVWEYSQYYLFWVCGSTPTSPIPLLRECSHKSGILLLGVLLYWNNMVLYHFCESTPAKVV